MPLSKDSNAAHDRGTGKVATRSETSGPRTLGGELAPGEPDPDSGLLYDRGTGKVAARSENGPLTVNAPTGEPAGRVASHDGPVTRESPVPYAKTPGAGRDAGTGRTAAASEQREQDDSKAVSADSPTVEDKAVRRRSGKREG